MVERKMETSATPHVTVDVCQGGLTVRGDAEGEIRLLAWDREDEVRLDRKGESVTVTIPGDGTLICPRGTTLTIDSVLGNLHVDGVTGSLALGTVHGNTTLVEVGPVALQVALGNLSAHGVAGDLTAQDVKGTAHVRDLEGQLKVQQVAGNLTADDLQGGLEAQRVRGNARLGPAFTAGETYRLSASGNLTLLLPADADLTLALRARGRVHAGVPGLDLETVDGETRATLGAGEGLVEADVRGSVMLRSVEPGEAFGLSAGLEELGAQIEWQVNDAMAELATRLESSLGRWDPEPMRRKIEEATEQARRKAEQAAERARMRAERAERRWQRASGERPRPQPKPASDEERLRVLRMVEEGRLTPEQASELLAALEGE
jgi:hypothetical protein